MLSKIPRTVRTNGVRQTIALGRDLARRLKPGMVVYLYGELGSGKTVLVKGFCRGLGVRETATSPSFVLVTEYRGRCPVIHIDLYRLHPRQIQDLAIEEYADPKAVTIIEWADRLPCRLPPPSLVIRISITGRRRREFTIENNRH